MLYYEIGITDSLFKKSAYSAPVTFDQRISIQRLINSADGNVSVELINMTKVNAVYIKATIPINVILNGTPLEVEGEFFSQLTALTSLAISCGDTDGATVQVMVWGE